MKLFNGDVSSSLLRHFYLLYMETSLIHVSTYGGGSGEDEGWVQVVAVAIPQFKKIIIILPAYYSIILLIYHLQLYMGTPTLDIYKCASK